MSVTETTHQDPRALPLSPLTTTIIKASRLKLHWAEWQIRRRHRMNLKRLLRVGPYMIDDIGLSLEEAEKELAKPRWRA